MRSVAWFSTAVAIVLGPWFVWSVPAQEPLLPAAAAPGPSFQVPAAAPLFVSEPGDGLSWARGLDWKASFGADGFTLVPFLGSSAPRNFPLQLRLCSARCGTTTLALDLHRSASARGNQRVEIDRGPLVE